MHTLFSFRRCPYAMRARYALIYAGIPYELVEVKLSDKPAKLLELSPKGTVPVLQLDGGRVIDESVEIVEYALSVNDPDTYALTTESENELCQQWLAEWQPTWVKAIKHYKYHERYPELDREKSWQDLAVLLQQVEDALHENNGYLLRNTPSQLDLLLLPFIRQFAIIDDAFFRRQNWKNMEGWLDAWMRSPIYERVMTKGEGW